MHAFYEMALTHGVVQLFLHAMEDGAADADWRPAFQRLVVVLPAHFAAEEEDGGFFSIVVARLGPDLLVEARRDHEALLVGLGHVERLLETDDPTVVDAARAFAGQLARHEARETELAVEVERANGFDLPDHR